MNRLTISLGLVAAALAGGCSTNRPPYGTAYAPPVYSGTTYVPATVPPPGTYVAPTYTATPAPAITAQPPQVVQQPQVIYYQQPQAVQPATYVAPANACQCMPTQCGCQQ